MKKIIIIYHSISGSTKRIAEIIHGELSKKHHVELCDISGVKNIDAYDFILMAGPMRFGGFIKNVNRFIRKNARVLAGKRVIYIQTCLYILQGIEDEKTQKPVYVDPSLNMGTKSIADMDFMDKNHRLIYYVDRLMNISPLVNPEMVAFFNGRLDLAKLGLVERAFMKIITMLTPRERIGDFINPPAVRGWAAELLSMISRS